MENDLISRSALHSTVCLDTQRGTYGEFMDGSEVSYTSKEVHSMIDEAPAVDAAPVVRCKDCKHSMLWRKPTDKVIGECAIRKWNSDIEEFCQVGADDFCSYGVRRADE